MAKKEAYLIIESIGWSGCYGVNPYAYNNYEVFATEDLANDRLKTLYNTMDEARISRKDIKVIENKLDSAGLHQTIVEVSNGNRTNMDYVIREVPFTYKEGDIL